MHVLRNAQQPLMGLHRYLLIALLLVIFVYPLSADDQDQFVIEKITFSISGKTKESIVRNTLSIEKGSSFSSFGDLEKAVESNRQNLFNRRIFEKVETNVEETAPGSRHYHVEFIITDAFTVLVLPYPKYDSNYGAKLGIKFYDKNFLGLLSNFYFNAQVRQLAVDDLSNFHFESYLDITDLQLYQKTIDFNNSLIIDQNLGELENGEFNSSLKISNIALGRNTFNLSTSAQLTQLESSSGIVWGDYNLDLGINWRGLNILFQDITLSGNVNLDATGQDITDSDITLSTSMTLPSFILFTPEISLYIRDSYEVPYEDWRSPTVHTISAGLTDTQTFLGFNHSMTLFAESDFLPEPFSSIDVGIQHTIRGGKINWHDNLRSGSTLVVSFLAKTPFNSGFSEAINNIKTVTSFATTSFIKIGSVLNLGFRAEGFLATHEKDNFGFPPGEQIRGILNKNILDQYGYKGLVLNTNLTIKMLGYTLYAFNKSIDGQLFISPFFDMVLMDQTSSDIHTLSPDLLCYSAGLEIYMIFDKYRSYPLSASFGFDLEDAIAVMNDEIEIGEMEFEIVLSLDLHF